MLVRYSLFVVLMGALSSCVTSKVLTDSKVIVPEEPSVEPVRILAPKPKRDFHQLVEVSIPITHEFGTGDLKADVFRPHKKTMPKTVVIMVPGSGNISRRGEVSSDGVDSYASPIDVNTLWAKALADRGLFVLSYDKRTCTTKINSICNTNDQQDIEQAGIISLARDLDQVYHFALTNLDAHHNEVRVVLMSTTQGAETIALSNNLRSISGVVLLSPVIGDLDTMWVSGLAKAAERSKSDSQRYQLHNRKESMAGFFASLKKGDFPETANVKGATVKFWLSWIEASKNALSYYKQSNKPVFMLFSEQDVFSHHLVSIKPQGAIKVKHYAGVDRNFVSPHGVSEQATEDVVTFINNLPTMVTP